MREQYCNRLETALSTINLENSPRITLVEMKGCIYEAIRYNPNVTTKQIYKQIWFNSKCLKARKKSFIYLKLFRKNNNETARALYLQVNKEYKNICFESRKNYYDSFGERLSSVRDANDWWKMLRELRQERFIHYNNIDHTTFRDYFEGLFNPQLTVRSTQYAEPLIVDVILDSEITAQEVRIVLDKCKCGKAPGLDRIPSEFYKFAPDSFISVMACEFNDYLNTGKVPDSFKTSIIFPLYKKGNSDDPANYRSLCFLDSICKIFTGVLLQRLSIWVETHQVLKECQAGFRKNYSTVDNIFSLCSIIKLYQLRAKKKLYVFFVDLKAAFDSIDRSALFYKMSIIGVSSKFIAIVKDLYTKTKGTVWHRGQLSDEFDIHMGVRQGDLPSPLLFSLFLNDLEEELGENGVIINGVKTNLLMYADDIAIIADDSRKLQVMIDKLSRYCDRWNLRVNMSKSKIMVFNSKGRRASNESWNYKCETIEVTNTYKYLGVILTPNLSFRMHIAERLTMAKYSINNTWSKFLNRKDIKLSAKFKLFDAVSRSILCYAAQIWGYEDYDEVDKLLRFFVKRIFCLPENTPTYMVHLETGLTKLFLHTLKMHLNYIIKVLALEESRLPRRLAVECMTSEVFWVPAISELGNRVSVDMDFNSMDARAWMQLKTNLLQSLETHFLDQFKERAEQSMFHDVYCRLRHDVCNYFNDDLPWNAIRLIFMTRGGLLDLNGRPWKKTTGLCSLCNKEEFENTYHFISVCPILAEIRSVHFGTQILDEETFLKYLNGRDWRVLYNYVEEAYNYRLSLVNEFNC